MMGKEGRERDEGKRGGRKKEMRKEGGERDEERGGRER